MPSWIHAVKTHFSTYYHGRASLTRTFILYYVLLRFIIALLIPATLITFASFSTETIHTIFSYAAIPGLLLIIFSWISLWKSSKQSRHFTSRLLVRLLISAEVIAVIWFTEIATF